MPRRPPTHKPFAQAARKHTPATEIRETSATRGYGSKWQSARIGYLARHPLCAECERQGRITPAKAVDHVIPHRGDMALFWDNTNWQSLCKTCHGIKTASEDGGFGNPRKSSSHRGVEKGQPDRA